jgi:SAM-dependent methyltransferase
MNASQSPNPGGPHLGGAIAEGDRNTTMPDVWGYLLVKYAPASVLDIGCGFGHTLRWFREHGLCTITGVEGWDEAIAKSVVPDAIVKHDFTQGPAPIGTPYDLVWSAEFLEHVDEEFLPHVMPAFRLGRYACVTHGEPGQFGHHHVNCQTTEYWIEVFHAAGFIYMPEETQLLRRTDRWRATWGRRTLTMFQRVR